MFHVPAHKYTPNFEEPLVVSMEDFYKKRVLELEQTVDQLRKELKYEREQRTFWFLKAGGLDKTIDL